MFDRKLLYTLVSVGAVVAVTVALELLPDRHDAALQQPLTLPPIAADEAARTSRLTPAARERVTRTPYPEQQTMYILREWNGYIAVFAHGEQEPQIVLEQQVRFLPDIDRMNLREGIIVADREELAALIEDYIS